MVDETSPSNLSVGRYEQTIDIRGCLISLEDIMALYRELFRINREFGIKVINSLKKREGMTDDEWESQKTFLYENTFRLTVTINGMSDEILYGESETVFQRPDLPLPIKRIYFTNVTAWQRNANNDLPPNSLEVRLDFQKPALLDPNPLMSEPTPNSSSVNVSAYDASFYRAVQQVVIEKLLSKQTRYAFLHRSFAYDFGMWFCVLPASLILATFSMNKAFPLGSEFETYRWALFIYVTGLGLLFYRVLAGYIKWAFPVNVLLDNKDRAWRHRVAISAIIVFCFGVLVNIAINIIS